VSNGEAFAMVACGAGLASILWSWLAWRETFQWMALVDRCHAILERQQHRIDTMRSFIDLEDKGGMTLDEFFDQRAAEAGGGECAKF
jgi:hypothetical protein